MRVKNNSRVVRKKINCACSNCENENVCRTEFGCYAAYGPQNCADVDECYGCFNNKFQLLQCGLKAQESQIHCCNEDFCNLNLTSIFKHGAIIHESNTTKIDSYATSSKIHSTLFISSIILVFFLFSFLIRSYLKCKTSKKLDSINEIKSRLKNSAAIHQQRLDSMILIEKNPSVATNCTTTTTTTGSGQGELIQRTIARDVRIDYSVGSLGQGRYGIVYPGEWKNDQVAVKFFFTMHELSWRREADIYQTCMLRHENILGFIAADIKTIHQSVNMILITEYHPLGSLFDYLTRHTLTEFVLYKFVCSISNGLNHLHQEIVGTRSKPSIAHRDLKTKNILVKKNFECCLADFGLAVKFDSERNQIDYGAGNCYAPKCREGSVRYMAPECLNDSIDLESIEDFKKVDIYSFALVIWEVLTRVELDGEEIREHTPAYFEYVEGDPAIDLMREIVCERKIRPSVKFQHLSLLNNKNLEQLIELMQECWSENPNCRLNSLNIKKKLKKFLNSFDENMS